ncbi:hypothetical protein Cni_G08696 [Canna indica]|uniref:Uncharacterized protein n=1 Tax=Canna indica TaxID=4628 RepID=A0AAQ3Q8X8_9LILI|nr:hypothetical protein Cni_G08696 [Canna indica]
MFSMKILRTQRVSSQMIPEIRFTPICPVRCRGGPTIAASLRPFPFGSGIGFYCPLWMMVLVFGPGLRIHEWKKSHLFSGGWR